MASGFACTESTGVRLADADSALAAAAWAFNLDRHAHLVYRHVSSLGIGRGDIADPSYDSLSSGDGDFWLSQQMQTALLTFQHHIERRAPSVTSSHQRRREIESPAQRMQIRAGA